MIEQRFLIESGDRIQIAREMQAAYEQMLLKSHYLINERQHAEQCLRVEFLGLSLDQKDVYIMRIGRMKTGVNDHEINILQKYHVHCMETLIRAAKQRNVFVDTHIKIIDCESFGISHTQPSMMSLLKSISKITSTYYPRTCNKIYLIRTPALFSFAWKLMKPLISKDLLTRVEFVHIDTLRSRLYANQFAKL